MRTHPLNVSSLVVGLIFLGLSGSWALREMGVIDADASRWILPLLLVAAGVVGVLAFTLKGIRPKESKMNTNTNHEETL